MSAANASPPPAPFADRLIARVRALGHPLCVGLDPHLDRIPSGFRCGSMRHDDPETAEAVEAFSLAVLEGVASQVAAVKPQIAFYEQLGWRGMRALARVMRAARDAGLLVVLDAKRGDIGSTATGYAAAYLSADAPLRADALTVNPYLGIDTLEPLAAAAASAGSGLFVLVKTSNPGSGTLQNLEAAGRPVYLHAAEALGDLADRLSGPATGWSSLGVVVGATYPDDAVRVREVVPRALFLVPGFGTQGAGAQDAVTSFVDGPTGLREGGLVNASRAVLFPEGAEAADRRVYGALLRDAVDRAADILARAVS